MEAVAAGTLLFVLVLVFETGSHWVVQPGHDLECSSLDLLGAGVTGVCHPAWLRGLAERTG